MNRLLGIQALRALAAGMVVYAHALMTHKERIDHTANITDLFPYGELGVTLFFCISGLIIFNSTIGLAPGIESIRIFAIKRLIRIVPAYWIATLIYATKLKIQGTDITAQALAKSLFFIPYTDSTGLMRPILGSGWTLNYEMLFYTVMAVFLVLRAPWRYISVVVLISALVVFGQMTAEYTHSNEPLRAIQLLSEPILLYFLAGMAIAQIAQSKIARRFSTDWRVGLFLACSALALFVLANYYFELTLPQRDAAQLLTCAVSVWCAANTRITEDRDDSLLMRKAVQWGDGSYSTYLTHGFIIGPVARVVSLGGFSVNPIAFAFAMVYLCNFLGEFIHRKAEVPIIKVLSSRLTPSRNASRKRRSPSEFST